MFVDDHAINSLKVFYDVACDNLKNEWNSKQYSSIPSCPSFREVYTYREALDVLYKGPGRFDDERVNHIIEIVKE